MTQKFYPNEQFYVDWFQNQVIMYEDLQDKSSSGVHLILDFKETLVYKNFFTFNCYVVEENKKDTFHIQLQKLIELHKLGENKKYKLAEFLFVTVLGK